MPYVKFDELLPGQLTEQVEYIGQGGRSPAPALVEELSERLGSLGVGVGRGTVVDPVTLLQ